jgi:hypothetical protein
LGIGKKTSIKGELLFISRCSQKWKWGGIFARAVHEKEDKTIFFNAI